MRAIHEKAQNTTQISESKAVSKEIRLDFEMLRMRVHQQLKHIQQPWQLSEKALCEYFNNYESLPDSAVNSRELFKIKGVRLVRSENKIYFGQISGKVKHGTGISLYRQGKIYEGEFCNNEKQGYGCEIYSNGNLYFGQFASNKKHGKGTFYWFNLSQPHCQKYQSTAVEQYVGDWWGGLPDGVGIHQKANGDLYRGRFKNGLKHGKGKQQFNNGDVYEGEYVNGLPEGSGEYFWKKGPHYKGDFKQGFKHGYGIWTKGATSHQLYKGHYVIDKRQGYGFYDWGNGYTYKGHFADDLRNGQGQLYFKQQLVYNGLWLNGQTAVQSKQESGKLKTKSAIFAKGNTLNKHTNNHNGSGIFSQGEKTLPKKSGNSSQNLRKNRSFFIRRELSATKPARSQNHDNRSYHVPLKCNPEHTAEQTCQDHHHRCGHRNCIPVFQFGKMPKPTWQNPRNNWKGPISPRKNQKKSY